jgi:hypothetical protein
MVEKIDPERFRDLLERADRLAAQRFAVYQQLAGIKIPRISADGDAEPPTAAAKK